MNTQNARRFMAMISLLMVVIIFTGAYSPIGNVNGLEPQDVSAVETTTLSEVEPSSEPETENVQEQISTIPETTTHTPEVKTTSPRIKGDYIYAEQVWDYLKNLGLNDYTCAGIMGNLMAEVGGQSLNLRPYATSSNGKYYGICQWSTKYNPSIKGASLEEQLEYLSSNLSSQMDSYGNRYKSGFDYNDFVELTDCRQAALAFAKCYERCASRHYSIRQRNAEIAYNYFVK